MLWRSVSVDIGVNVKAAKAMTGRKPIEVAGEEACRNKRPEGNRVTMKIVLFEVINVGRRNMSIQCVM